MELSLTVCKICNQEHTTVGENTENLWINLCMFCKHEIKRTNQFLAQLEKSSSFLISTARIFESVIKTESEEQMGGKNIRLCIDSDKIVLAPELPSAFSFVEKSYSFCEQNSPPIDIKMEYSDDINLKPEAPDRSPFIEDKYSEFCEQNSPLMDIEYVGVDEENIFVKVQQTSDRLLPEKSKNRYQHEAVLFKNWQQKNSIKSVTEDVVIAYIDEMSKKYSPSSIYTKTCMLKTTLLAKENIDIFKFEKVNPYLRQHYAGYKSKESKTLSETEVLKFLNEAPDHDYLMQKVVLNFRIFGACRCAELASMKVSDIEDRGSVVVVNIPGTNNYKKSFCLVDDNKFNAIKLYRKYAALRPKEISSDRFFLCYKKGRCVKQVVGKNSFGNLPCKIATYLGLVDAYLYRGHYLRKTSAAHVVDETGDILGPKRSYGSESSSITEHYSDDSMKCHKKIFKLESNQEDFLPEDVFNVETRERYRREGVLFKNWQQENQIESVCENVIMAYINEMSKKYAPTSLYTKTYMLKTMLQEEENIDISKFEKVNAYLRQNAVGYMPKTSKTLSQTEVLKFLKEAPDDDYLMHKVVLIFGIFGACRCNELTYMKVSDIEDRGSIVVISIPETKHKKRSFCLLENDKYNAIKIYRKYAALRPKETGHDRFFLLYKNGHCTKQVVGKNSIGNIPCKIATYLGLVDPDLYTGQCMRRTSATKFIDRTGDIVRPKRLGHWESTSIAEDYVDEDTVPKPKVFKVELRPQDCLPEEM